MHVKGCVLSAQTELQVVSVRRDWSCRWQRLHKQSSSITLSWGKEEDSVRNSQMSLCSGWARPVFVPTLTRRQVFDVKVVSALNVAYFSCLLACYNRECLFIVTWKGTSKLGDIYNSAPCDLLILAFCVCTILSQKKRQTKAASACARIHASCGRTFVTALATVGYGGSRSRVRSSAVLPVTQRSTVLTKARLSFTSVLHWGHGCRSGSAGCW